MSPASPASEFALAVLVEFVRLGVTHIVVCPGSRSQALALAAAELERMGTITLTVRIDERGAGFLALGSAVESGVPALVITTSGTAVGNLFPSVLEAHHSGVPMILVTADRPEELRGIGSNQTTQQVGIFGEFVRFARDVEAPSDTEFDQGFPGELAREAFAAAIGRSTTPGPVQVNLAFREPLSGVLDIAALRERLGVSRADVVAMNRGRASEALTIDSSTIVVAGNRSGPEAEEAARALGAPLLAEVCSGAHFGPNLVVAYRELLTQPEFAERVNRVIIFGHPTLSREIPALVHREGVETIVVRGGFAEDFNPGHRVSRFVDGVAALGSTDQVDPSWPGAWVAASRSVLDAGTTVDPSLARTDDSRAVAAFTRSQLGVFREPVTRRMLVEAVWQKTWPHDRLLFGSSRLIREADRVVGGKRVRVYANRGLAGIDGTIATGLGIAIASQSTDPSTPTTRSGNAASGTTRVVLGDLAFLHDSGSLLMSPGEPELRIQLIVGNDGGGTIFDSLEVASTARSESFDRVLYTPQNASIRSLAEAYGWNYSLAGNRGELDEALSSANGHSVIEVPLPRS